MKQNFGIKLKMRGGKFRLLVLKIAPLMVLQTCYARTKTMYFYYRIKAKFG